MHCVPTKIPTCTIALVAHWNSRKKSKKSPFKGASAHHPETDRMLEATFSKQNTFKRQNNKKLKKFRSSAQEISASTWKTMMTAIFGVTSTAAVSAWRIFRLLMTQHPKKNMSISWVICWRSASALIILVRFHLLWTTRPFSFLSQMMNTCYWM